jgi:hypothetical protein
MSGDTITSNMEKATHSTKILVMEEEAQKKVPLIKESKQEEEKFVPQQRTVTTLTPTNKEEDSVSDTVWKTANRAAYGSFVSSVVMDLLVLDATWIAIRLLGRFIGF